MADEGILRIASLHLQRYLGMQIADLLKLLFQHEFGAEHLISDVAASLRRIEDEIATLSEKALHGDAVEDIGNGLCRIHLRACVRGECSIEQLNSLFLETANHPRGSIPGFVSKALLLKGYCLKGGLPFDPDALSAALASHAEAGYPALHHSQSFRELYAPAYRVVEKDLFDRLL